MGLLYRMCTGSVSTHGSSASRPDQNPLFDTAGVTKLALRGAGRAFRIGGSVATVGSEGASGVFVSGSVWALTRL